MFFVLLSLSFEANAKCHSRFTNPITDICWKCILPISIGDFSVGKGFAPAKRDTKNPKTPICACRKEGFELPVPGITLGFWEPARMVDITRTPYCMVGLGLELQTEDVRKKGSYYRAYGNRRVHDSYYHLHYYIYPLIYWLELLTDLICLEPSTFDVAYLSELDPTWHDDKLQTLLNPEVFLFANPLAQAACSADCAMASVSTASDSLFWCAGCYGNMYPWGGWNADHVGGVQNSSLLTTRILAKMHRVGLAKDTTTSDNTIINGNICKKRTALTIKKSQYKLQMLYPKSSASLSSNDGPIGCWPLGLSDMMYSEFKEYPWDGEDWSYLIWRKSTCCAF